MVDAGKLASGRIDKAGTVFTLYRDGTFTTMGLFSTSPRDRLLGFQSDIDSMRRKSVTGRGAAFLLTGGMSILAGNNRGVVYVTITGRHSGTKTYTSKNPEDSLLSSVRSLQAASDALLSSPPAAESQAKTLGDPGEGPYANHPVLGGLLREVREMIAGQLSLDRKIGAIQTLRENFDGDISLKEAKDTIDRLVEFPDEGATPPRSEPRPQPKSQPDAGAGPSSHRAEETMDIPEGKHDVAAQLKLLAELYASGALSDEEFAAAKARILS